jgi:hypothetical protein
LINGSPPTFMPKMPLTSVTGSISDVTIDRNSRLRYGPPCDLSVGRRRPDVAGPSAELLSETDRPNLGP